MKRLRSILTVNPTILTLIFLIFMRYSNSITLTRDPQFQCEQFVLYNSATEMPASSTSSFSVPFISAFRSQPSVALVLKGYSSLDQLYNQLWGLTYTIANTNASITINVRIQTNTRTNLLRAGYFAVDPTFVPGLFTFYHVELVTALANTRSGTGARSDLITYQPTPVPYFGAGVYPFHMTNILYMRNGGNFGFTIGVTMVEQYNTTINQTFSKSMLIQINSTGDNRLEKLGLHIIVVNFAKISYENYYQGYIGKVEITSTTTTLNLYTLNVQESSLSVTNVTINETWQGCNLFGFSSWSSNPAIGAKFHWQIDGVGLTKVLQLFNPNRIALINYNFLIFGHVNCGTDLWSIVNQTCVAACSSNEVVDLDKPVCRPCVIHCLICSILHTNCTSCESGYYLLNNTCQVCEDRLELTACGYIPPDDPTPPTTTPPAIQHSPYWLASLSVIPLIGILVYCYCRHKKNIASISVERASDFKEHPSISF